MMKNTVDPMATQAGVFAALMAKRGYTGTEAVFEGKEGFMDCFLGYNAKEQKVEPQSMKGEMEFLNGNGILKNLLADLVNHIKFLNAV